MPELPITDPDADEARGLATLAEAGDRIVDGVERLGAGWVEREVGRIAAAWGRLDDDARRALREEAATAGRAARDRVVAELRDLLARDPADQRATPLEVVRSLRREATGVLRAAGIPPVTRDEFDARAHPDDDYDLAPRTLADLGDPDLGPLLLAWGLAKATVLRARAVRAAARDRDGGRDGG